MSKNTGHRLKFLLSFSTQHSAGCVPKQIAMSRGTDFSLVWYMDLCSCTPLMQRLHKALRNHNMTLQPWDRNADVIFGLILVSGEEQYEALISVLNLQLKHRNNRVIVLNTSTAAFSTESVFRVLKYGAEHFLSLLSLGDSLEGITEKLTRWRNIEVMANAPAVRNFIVGESPALKKLLRGLVEVAAYADVAVLVEGERGTGKESMARLVHDLDKRRGHYDLVLVDCATIRPELSGSEFFGHEKGAYTGADNTREGAFAQSHNGTLFLDEIGELPLSMQAELLRIIQEGAYKKLGGNLWKQANFRLVCATNRDLLHQCERNLFRQDLYDRISVWKCRMPSLRERKTDIPLLVDFFLRKRFPEGAPPVDDNVMAYLQERDYGGNVRELKNLVARMALKYVGKGPITLGDIPADDRTAAVEQEEQWYKSAAFTNTIVEALTCGYDAKQIMDIVKSQVTKVALSTASNNKEVSKLLGKSERWIQLQKAKER